MGYAHPDHLLRELDSRQIAEWIAFHNLEPFGEQVDWLRTGILASLTANVNRKQGVKPFKPEDFMPQEPKHPSEVEKAEEMKSKILDLFGIKDESNG